MPDVVRIGVQRRVHPASPSAVPRVRKDAPVINEQQHEPKTPENPPGRRQS
jgi:hypothetical protein